MVEIDETIHPCKGCEDFNPLTRECKSNGGCGEYFRERSRTMDVVEVRHSQWVHLGGDEWLCQDCGLVITTEGSWEHPMERGYKFCYNCGAKMDGKEQDNA